jgi:hypothetical protein
MYPIQTRVHIGDDGMLKLSLPVGFVNADALVTVAVEPVNGAPPSMLEESRAFVQQFSGRWQGALLVRPCQGEFEVRQDLG